MSHFVLQSIDPLYNCSTLETLITSPDVGVLKTQLGSDCADDPDLRYGYTLDPEEARAIATHFGVGFDPIGPKTMLSRLGWRAEVPYLIHTNRELFLMPNGTKPFATSAIAYPTREGDGAVEILFEPHVQPGRIIKRVVVEPFDPPMAGYRNGPYDGFRNLYYALPGEEWRIDANLLLWSQLKYVAWNETMERIWGRLLGYTDAQNDWWIAHLRHEGTSWGSATAYAVVDAAALDWIRASGCRALPWATPGFEIRLELRWPHPDVAALQQWMQATDSAAVIRLGLTRDYLTARAVELRDGIRTYLIPPDAVPELNGNLNRQIEIIAEGSQTG